MAEGGVKSLGPTAWKSGLSKYRKRLDTLIPSSLHQMVSSEKIICGLLKDIYGLTYKDIQKVDVHRQDTHDGIKGHLSDSGRIMVKVLLDDGHETTYHWFVKIQPQHQQTGFNVFKNEIEFYSRIAPTLKNFLKTMNVQDEVNLDIPDVLYTREDGNRAIIILPDLVNEGFHQERNENGHRFLTKRKAVLALQCLAKIQATSYAMKLLTDIDLQKLYPALKEAGTFWTDKEVISKLMMMKNVFSNHLKASEELDAPLLFDDFNAAFKSEEFLVNLCKRRYLQANSLKCLQHGDFHFNNLLFKEDHGCLKVMIVDWQLTYLGNAAGDPSYLMLSSLDPELRKLEEQDIKRTYFDSYIKTLKIIDNKTTLDDILLEESYKDSLHLSFFFACGNVMQEESSSEEFKDNFAYTLCKEAKERGLF